LLKCQLIDLGREKDRALTQVVSHGGRCLRERRVVIEGTFQEREGNGPLPDGLMNESLIDQALGDIDAGTE
jgi:hypothetical protein